MRIRRYWVSGAIYASVCTSIGILHLCCGHNLFNFADFGFGGETAVRCLSRQVRISCHLCYFVVKEKN